MCRVARQLSAQGAVLEQRAQHDDAADHDRGQQGSVRPEDERRCQIGEERAAGAGVADRAKPWVAITLTGLLHTPTKPARAKAGRADPKSIEGLLGTAPRDVGRAVPEVAGGLGGWKVTPR